MTQLLHFSLYFLLLGLMVSPGKPKIERWVDRPQNVEPVQ